MRIEGQGSENMYGETIAFDEDEVITSIYAEDAYAPEIAEYSADDTAGRYDEGDKMVEVTTDGVIKITFTETLDTATVSKLTFSIEGEKVDNVTFENDDTVVVLHFTPDKDTKDEPKVTMNYKVADGEGNEYKADSTLYSIDLR
jgi:hypothetical protein